MEQLLEDYGLEEKRRDFGLLEDRSLEERFYRDGIFGWLSDR